VPYNIPKMHIEYLRAEPPGVPTAFGRNVGPSHNVFVTESFLDELAAAAKQDPVAYRRALLDKSPRAKTVLELFLATSAIRSSRSARSNNSSRAFSDMRLAR
jgi:isoquinoline 1-oxidoreductase beta subunit